MFIITDTNTLSLAPKLNTLRIEATAEVLSRRILFHGVYMCLHATDRSKIQLLSVGARIAQ
jgi:hypothetical protein